MTRLLVNFAAFQVGWFSCVLGAAHGQPWIGPAVVLAVVLLHLGLARRPAEELRLVVSAICVGLVADSLLVMTGWVSYPAGNWVPGLAPYWILAMWALFATTLNVSMKWMRDRPFVAIVMGAAGGPLSYLAGQKLGAMQFNEPLFALVALAFIWAIAMPMLMAISSRFDGVSKGSKPQYVLEDWKASQHV
jgi:hypothetical protein